MLLQMLVLLLLLSGGVLPVRRPRLRILIVVRHTVAPTHARPVRAVAVHRRAAAVHHRRLVLLVRVRRERRARPRGPLRLERHERRRGRVQLRPHRRNRGRRQRGGRRVRRRDRARSRGCRSARLGGGRHRAGAAEAERTRTARETKKEPRREGGALEGRKRATRRRSPPIGKWRLETRFRKTNARKSTGWLRGLTRLRHLLQPERVSVRGPPRAALWPADLALRVWNRRTSCAQAHAAAQVCV